MSATDGARETLVGISTGVNNMQMDESVKAAITGTLGQMFAMLDIISRISSDIGVLSSSSLSDKMRFEGEIKSIIHQTGLVQGAVDTLVKQNEDKKQGGGGHKKWNVLESKSIANMKSLGSDKTGFERGMRSWSV